MTENIWVSFKKKVTKIFSLVILLITELIIFNLRTKIIIESINVVVNVLIDVAGPPSEGKAVDLTEEVEKQFQNSVATPSVATETKFESETESSNFNY